MKIATLVALCAVLTACAGGPSMASHERELLAADVRDAASVAQRLAPEESQAYFDVLTPMLDAFIAGDQEFGYREAFNALNALEPAMRKALKARGMKAEQVESTVLLERILLRRIQAQVIR